VAVTRIASPLTQRINDAAISSPRRPPRPSCGTSSASGAPPPAPAASASPAASGRAATAGTLVDTRGVPIEIDDPADVRLADYTRLTDASLRTHLEAEHGLFIAEGTKVITRAVAAGYPVRSVLLGRSRLADIPALDVTTAPVYVVPDAVAESLTGYRVHRGALASLARKSLPGVASVVSGARRVVVLEDLVDHGNVGAIFRCAAALGIDAVVLSPRCADPLYRRSVKVSMGAVFAIPYARMTGWFDGLAELKSAGFRTLALTPDERATPIASALRDAERVALLLGTEGDGLTARWLHEADAAVRIPMNPAARAAGVDSLNVVAAAAIACHLLVQHR
jgi:tRNA G18 (ribose-2'-O)-methylase SpoU